MAGTITHFKVGKNILQKLPIDIDKDIFLLACQGHDLLYFIRLYELPKYHEKTHLVEMLQDTKFDEFVREYSKEIIANNLDKKLKSFLYGYIAHHLTDSIFHPFINYFSKKYNHALIESIIDTKVLDIPTLIKELPKLKDTKNLAKTTEKVIYKVYKEKNVGKTLIINMNHIKFFLIFYRLDKTGIKKLGYQIIDKITHKYYEFLSYNYPKEYLNWQIDEKTSWQDPITGQKNYSSISDLIDESTTKIIDILNAIDKSLTNKKVADINLNISATHGRKLNTTYEQKYFLN